MIKPGNASTSPSIGIDPLTLHSVVDLAEAVPFLLGFHPQHSVVALMLDFPPPGTDEPSPMRLRLSLTARVDIGSGEALPIGDALDTTIGDHDAIALLAFTDDTRIGQNLLRALRRRWATPTVSAAIVTTSVTLDMITDTEHPRHRESAGRAAAEAIGRGMMIKYASREQLASSVQLDQAATPLDHRVRAELAECSGTPDPGHTAKLISLLGSAMRGCTADLDDAVLVSLAVAVQHVAVRDHMWAAMTVEDAYRHMRVWVGLAQRLGSDLCLPVLGLLGFASWLLGDGALANIALERAQTVSGSEDYSMIMLLARILASAIPPDEWRRVSAQIRAELAVH